MIIILKRLFLSLQFLPFFFRATQHIIKGDPIMPKVHLFYFTCSYLVLPTDKALLLAGSVIREQFGYIVSPDSTFMQQRPCCSWAASFDGIPLTYPPLGKQELFTCNGLALSPHSRTGPCTKLATQGRHFHFPGLKAPLHFWLPHTAQCSTPELSTPGPTSRGVWWTSLSS